MVSRDQTPPEGLTHWARQQLTWREGGEAEKTRGTGRGGAGQDSRVKGVDTEMDTNRQRRRRGGNKGETKAES